MTYKEKIIATAYTGIMFVDGSQLGDVYAYEEAIRDGYNDEIAKYVAAQVHHAFEIGWNSAITNSINLLKKLDID